MRNGNKIFWQLWIFLAFFMVFLVQFKSSILLPPFTWIASCKQPFIIWDQFEESEYLVGCLVTVDDYLNRHRKQWILFQRHVVALLISTLTLSLHNNLQQVISSPGALFVFYVINSVLWHISSLIFPLSDIIT